VVKLPFGRSRRELRARRLLLAEGEAVEVPCRMRRTSARGWGQWTSAVLSLGPRGGGLASWQASDPLAVGLTPSRAGRPVPMGEVLDVELRRVRFREEAFHGDDAEIIVVTAERHITELALVPADVAEVYRRLGGIPADESPTPIERR